MRGRHGALAGPEARRAGPWVPLNDAIFQRMEGNHSQTPAGFQQSFGRREAFGQLIQLCVEKEAKRLKRAGRGMLSLVPLAANYADHNVGEVASPHDGGFGTPGHNSPGNDTRPPFLSKSINDFRKFRFRQRIDYIRGGRAVGRAVLGEGKAPLGLVELHRGDAKIECHAVDG